MRLNERAERLRELQDYLDIAQKVSGPIFAAQYASSIFELERTCEDQEWQKKLAD
jgi:hypothetical protein